MKTEMLSFKDLEGKNISYYKWSPENDEYKGVIQIAHGLSETAARYERFAKWLTEAGYIVYANDHRGHGKTAGSVDNLGYAGVDGFNWMIKDMKQLNDIAREENAGKPLFLFGHSMGSFLAQRYITLHGEELKGVILSGTSGKQGMVLNVGIFLAKRGIKKWGAKAKANNINNLTFGGYNKPFKPSRTSFDWLSRDNAEVDKYISDSYCGTVPTYGFFNDLFAALKTLHRRVTMDKIPRELPIYLFSGEKDPVGGSTKSVLSLIKLYKKIGVKDVSYKFYVEGRHEMLNEINRDEVMQDNLKWLEEHI
jgi:alpha-beta hydrolase superfamily lysophospholipase